MKSTKSKFEKIDLRELQKLLPEAVLDGHNKRASDLPAKPPARSKPKVKATGKIKPGPDSVSKRTGGPRTGQPK